MRRIALATGLALLILSGGVSPPLARAAGPFDDLLIRTSSNTNVLVLVDVKSAFASPLAKAEKWNERVQAGTHGALGFVPPDAEVVVIAGEVNLTTLVRDFQIGLVRVRNVPSMAELATREGGTSDEIAGRLAVLSPRDVYFTTFSGRELVALYPADRQYVARYLRSAMAAKEAPLHPFLKQAAAKAGDNTVTIAVDLEDVVDRTVLRMSLPSSPTVAQVKGLDVNLLSRFLASVKGLTFSAKITDSINASISLEFVGDAAQFRRTLPDLLRELIESQGIAIQGFEKWEPTFTDSTMTLSGKLTSDDLQRILSLFAFPSAPGESDPKQKGNEPSAPLTRRYIAAVEAILANIRSLRDTPNYEKTATWHDKAAAQIEQLSKRGVDPAASDAALQAAKGLHAIAASLRGTPIDLEELASQQFYYSRPSIGIAPGFWGWQPFMFGPAQVDTNIPKIQAEMARVIAEDKKKRQEVWSQIDRSLMETRRKLSEKFKTDI